MDEREDRECLREVLIDVGSSARVSRTEKLTLFAGRSGPLANNGLMVVGRAVNGWSNCWLADDLHGEYIDTLVDAALRDSTPTSDHDPMSWITDQWGSRERYNSRRSAFWRTVRRVALGFSDRQESDERQWASRLTWTNLYKVAPAGGGNPRHRLQDAQRRACIQTLEAEVRLWNPSHLLFLTGRSWCERFLQELGWKLTTARGGVELVGAVGATQVVVAPHPQGKPEAMLAQEIVRGFSSRA